MEELQKIHELASLVNANDFKLYTVQSLLSRFAGFEDQYRYDQVFRNVQQVMEKKAFDNPNAVVSAEELSKIANQFATLGSTEVFKRIAGDLLPEVMVQEDNSAEKHLEATRHLYNEDGTRAPQREAAIEVDENEPLTLDVPNPYMGIFDKQDGKFGYLQNPELVQRGQYLVEDELRGLGYTSSVSYSTCNTDTLLYSAAIDTDFGKQRIFVPVEMADSQVLYPTSFATNSKMYELSKSGVDNFLNDKKADVFSKQMRMADGIRDNMLSNTIREMKNDGSFEVDENNYLDQKIAMPEELIPVERILEDSYLKKESKYSDDQITMAMGLLRDEITKCGYRSELRFAGDNENGIDVTVTVQAPEGKMEIKAPVEILKGGQVLFPSKFVSASSSSEVEVGASEYALSKEGFSEFIANNHESIMPIRYAGELVGLDLNNLRKMVYQSTKAKRYASAEEALNVIADKYGEDVHASAMEDYKEWLLNKSLDFKDNFGLGMRASVDDREAGWEGAIMTSQIKLT